MRHIKFQASLDAAQTTVTVVILEQIHMYYDFVPDGSRNYQGPRMTITSCNCPASTGINQAFVRGDTPSKHLKPIHFGLAEYECFKEAVMAYNEEFKD